MGFRIEIRRVQVVERWVRAIDDEAALAKVRSDAAEPWGQWRMGAKAARSGWRGWRVVERPSGWLLATRSDDDDERHEQSDGHQEHNQDDEKFG